LSTLRPTALAPLLVLLVSACGGGGGGGEPATVDLTLTNAAVEQTVYEGDGGTLVIPGILLKGGPAVDEETWIRFTPDNASVLGASVTFAYQPNETSFGWAASVSAGLALGEYTGTIGVQACADEDCVFVYDAAAQPYTVNVLSHTNLTTLTALPGAGAWTMLQGGPAHTGYVPVTLDPAAFLSRWRVNLSPGGGSITFQPAVTIEDGIVYLSTGSSGPMVQARSEHDGSQVWQTSNSSSGHSAPAVANGVAFIVGNASTPAIRKIIAGTVQSEVGTFGLNNNYFPDPASPTLHGGKVYANGGTYYGTHAFDASTLALLWAKPMGGSIISTPAVDGTAVYAAGDDGEGSGSLVALDPANGELLWRADLFTLPDVGTYGITPVISDLGRVVVPMPKRLSVVDSSTHEVLWSATGGFDISGLNVEARAPAVANGVVYSTTNVPSLVARDEATGAVLWVWAPPIHTSTFIGNVVATDSHVFVSSYNEVTGGVTHAIDLATRQAVWSYPRPGNLSISENGILYISSQGSHYLIAINLH